MLENVFGYHGRKNREPKFLFYLLSAVVVSLVALWILL